MEDKIVFKGVRGYDIKWENVKTLFDLQQIVSTINLMHMSSGDTKYRGIKYLLDGGLITENNQDGNNNT